MFAAEVKESQFRVLWLLQPCHSYRIPLLYFLIGLGVISIFQFVPRAASWKLTTDVPTDRIVAVPALCFGYGLELSDAFGIQSHSMSFNSFGTVNLPMTL